MSHRRRLAAAVLTTVALLVSACGSSQDASPAKADRALSRAEKSFAALRKQVASTGTGRFGQAISNSEGRVVSQTAGSYSVKAGQVRARLSIPDGLGKGKDAAVTVLESGGNAWVRTNQFPKAVAGCYLTTTPEGLFTQYGIDVATGGGAEPTALRLLSAFRPASTSGGGVLQGALPLADVVVLLPPALAPRLAQAEPQGTVPATIGISGRQVTIAVAGFSLVGALTAAIKGATEAQFEALRGMHFDASLTPLKGAFASVSAPPAGRTMTAAQLAAGKCG